MCTGTGESFLLSVLGVIALCFYFILAPGLMIYVFIVLVPRDGLDNESLNCHFGFLWSRFEKRIYWWEAVDMIRKVGGLEGLP